MFSLIRKLSSNNRSTLVTCFLIYMCSGMFALMMGSMMPDLRETYHLTDSMSGVLLSAHSIGNMIMGFTSALIPLCLGEKRSIMLLFSLLAVGFVMVVLWGNPAWLFVAFLLTGFGRGSVTNFTNRTVNVVSGGSPAASNLLHAQFAVGAIFSPMMFLAVRTWLGWRWAVITAVVIGMIGLWRLTTLQLERERPDRRDKANSTFVFLKNPSFLILGMMMFFYLCTEYGVNGWLVTYIQSRESLLSGLAASGEELTSAVRAYSQAMATLLWVMILVGRLFCAVASTKISQKKMLFVFSVGVVVFYALMLSSSSLSVVTFCVAGLGFCMAGISPMIYSDASAFTTRYPMATSVLLAMGFAGAILMPTLVGALAERFGFGGGMSAVLASALLLVVSSALNLTRKRNVPEKAS